MRLQKYLAWCGVASRRKAEELITRGQIAVNGIVITQMGYFIETDRDNVTCDGRTVEQHEKQICIMLHKPVGYITSANDQFGRRTVMDLVGDIKERIYPIGRLDYDTSGLLLLTNDGSLTYELTHPRHNVGKTYLAVIRGNPDKGKLDRFRSGLMIDGIKTAAAKIEIIKRAPSESTVTIILHEGRNRQIRKMCEAIGHPVIRLKRVAIGGLTLGDLPVGHHRTLSAQELKKLINKV